MNEKEKMKIKIPFHLNKFYREKLLSQEFKIFIPNNKDKNENNTKIKSKKGENITHYIEKRNANLSSPIIKFSSSNFFPPLLKGNNIFKKKDSQKRLKGIDNYMSNGYKTKEKKDEYQLLRLTKKINLKEIVERNNFSKYKAGTLKQKIYRYKSEIDETKDNHKFFKSNTIQTPFRNNNIKIINANNRSKKFYPLKTIELIPSNLKITQSHDKYALNNKNTDKTNDDEQSNYFRRTYKFTSCERYGKKKIMLKYCVYPGNNAKLIDLVMQSRNDIWEKVPTSHYKYCDMIWAPTTRNIDFKTSQIMHSFVNHIPLSDELSNKMRLYANLIQHCEKKNIDVYRIFPFTIILTLSHYTFKEQMENFKTLFKEIDKYTPKSDVYFSKLFNALLNKKIGSNQTINIPKTFNSGKKLWIIKPDNLNRGRCIKVLNNLHDIIKEMKIIQTYRKINLIENKNRKFNIGDINQEKEKSIKCDYILIQKYLERPLLYQGRKFDIRIWVMLIANREKEIFIFKEGHLKATSLKYNPDSDNLFIHLTNYSVQKYHSHFSELEIGNEIPFYDFQYELDRNRSKKNFKKDIYPKIVRIVRLTGGAAKVGKINFMNYKNCFEIFGYDFILDENYKPYLLEINCNPGLEFSSPLIRQLLPRMIDDAFKLTIDEEYSLSNIFKHQESTFPVDYYKNDENLWERYTIL